MTNTKTVKSILIKHNALHLDIDQIDDTILNGRFIQTFSRTNAIWNTERQEHGDPDEFIYDAVRKFRIATWRDNSYKNLGVQIS